MVPNSNRQNKSGARRSRTGCLYCRGRKIKCDEKYPSCGECSRIGKKCDRTTPIFRQYRSSFAAPVAATSPTDSMSANGANIDERPWHKQSPTFVSMSDADPGEDLSQEQHPDIETPDDRSPLLAEASPESVLTRRHRAARNLQQSIRAPTATVVEFSGECLEPPIVSLSDSDFLNHQSTLPHTPRESYVIEESDNTSTEEARQISFFLRHFSETPGRWMDLFDLDRYYSLQVPVLARHNPLVKYAACAFAAKQLGLVHGRKSVRGGVANRLSAMELWPEHSAVDYAWHGMKYYDKSISLLMEYISEGDHSHRDDYNQRYDDETIVAATILCNYEFLSATTTGWSRHLDGTESLLRLSNQGLFRFQPSPRPSPVTPTPPKALRASFWNFARQDFLASIITRRSGRLDLDDLDMWRAMGLLVDENGVVFAGDTGETSRILMQDDMVSNTLIWLLCKIANFIAAGSQDGNPGDHRDTPTDDEQQTATWRALDLEITAWHAGLPPTFQPSARVRIDHSTSPNLQSETWYSNSMCASTIQSYHMARMLLLIYRPARVLLSASYVSEAPTSRQDLLSVYRAMQIELRGHAAEICSIARGRPDDSARVHMLQPMYFAGRCFTDPKDQGIVIELIRDIERDLGWATQYRVDQLLQEWEA